jgi:hypothetical protein
VHLCGRASEDHSSVGDTIDPYVEECAAAEGWVEESSFAVELCSEAKVTLELARFTDGA